MSGIAVGVIGGLGAIGGALIGSSAAESSAHMQAQAEMAALHQQQTMYDQTVGREQPFVQGGTDAMSQLNFLLGTGPRTATPGTAEANAIGNAPGAYGSLNTPFTADMMKQYSPGYQFQLQQGGQGVLNQASSGQGSMSGAALSGLIGFNQGFAGSAFNNAFNQYQQQQSNTYNRLMGVATLGQGAASNAATGGSAYATAMGNTAGAIGASQASGTIGAANAITGGISNSVNAAMPWLMSKTPSTPPPVTGDYMLNGPQ